MRKPLVLVVEDEAAVREAVCAELSAVLEELARVEGCAGGAEALERVARCPEERRRVALLVVDESMPGMSGTELLVRLRSGGERVRAAAGRVRCC